MELNRLLSAVLSIVVGAIVTGTTSAWAVEQLTVTAQKREESVLEVPLAVSAFSGNQLEERNYTSLEDFRGAVPGLQVNNYIGQARINIRGLGSNSLSFGADSQVAFNVNGVYAGRSTQAAQAFLDIDRIEIVRGPQGTLYGRNATGGAVNVITRRPTNEFEAYAQLNIGNYEHIRSEAVLSGPLVKDRILARIAVSTTDRNGYAHNLFDDRDYDDERTRTVRGTVVFNLNDDVTFTVVGDYFHEKDGNFPTYFLGLSPGFPVLAGVAFGGMTTPVGPDGQVIDPRILNINSVPDYRQESYGVTGELEWRLNDQLTFKSISAYRSRDLSLTADYDATPTQFPSLVGDTDFAAWESAEQFSQEIQFSGDYGWINWVAGLYYFREHIEPAFFQIGLNFGTIDFPFITQLRLGGGTVTNAYAAFGQATVFVTDKLSVTAGLRYSYERRRADIEQVLPGLGVVQPDSDTASFDDISPKFSLSYQWTDNLVTYVTVSKGFKSGGYDISASPPLMPFDPEKIWAYEAGIKYQNDWFYGDLSFFHYDYTNLQVNQILNDLPTTANAASSNIDGVELSATIEPAVGLTITGAFSYLDARFVEFTELNVLTGVEEDLAGNQLPAAPKYQANISVAYAIPVGDHELTLFGEWNWHDRIYHTEFNSDLVSQPATSTFNASARFTHKSERWSIELYGKNLSNEHIVSASWISSAAFGFPINGQLRPPRTYGVILHYALN